MADTLTNERLQLAADRLGGLEEIDRSTYPEFFDDAGILANAARQLLSRRTAPAEPVAWVTEEILAAMKRGDRAVPGWKRTDAFCIPLYAAPPSSPTVSDGMVERLERELHAARAVIEAQRIRLVEMQRWTLSLGGHHD